MTTTDPFTDARAEAEARYPIPMSDTRALVYPVAVMRAHSRAAFVAGAEWEGDRRAERCPTCGEDPAGPLRPLTTDRRSYQRAQDLGYELPEEPR